MEYRVTILTATYNRSHLLKRLYLSIISQSYKDIEWLVIDDGSTDDTEDLIQQLILEKAIEIKYYKQSNKGKHIALNYGFNLNNNSLLIIIDSDDEFTPYGLGALIACWKCQKEKSSVAAIVGNDINRDGKIIGKRLRKESLKCTYRDFVQKYRISGDKAFLWNFEILNQFRFPEFSGEKFISEIALWEKLNSYFLVYLNTDVFKVEYLTTGLSSNSLKLRVSNIQGTLYCYSNSLVNSSTFYFRYKNLINLMRFSIHNNESLRDIIKKTPNKFDGILLYSISYILYFLDKNHLKLKKG